MKQMVIRRSGRVAVPSAAGCLFLVLSCDISVPDEARLQSLSEPELIELCDGLGDDLRGSAQVRECGDARSVALNSPHESWCTGEDLSSCRATAGDLRACHAAAWAAPCGAGERLPEECAPLFEAGCAPWATASPVYPFCELPLEEVAPFEGIYELTRHTRNEGSCVSEGGSVLELDGERLLVVKGQVNVDGAARATIRSCRDEPDCRAVAADPADAALPELQRDLDCRAANTVGLEGRGVRYGDADEECQIVHVDSVTSRAPGGILQLREYETTWSMGANSGCFYVSDLIPPGASCGALDVYEARLITPL